MSVGVLRNSNKGLDISELILETTEELKQHLKQMDTASTRQMGANCSIHVAHAFQKLSS